MPSRAMSSPVIGRSGVSAPREDHYSAKLNSVLTGHVEHGVSQGMIRGRYEPGTAEYRDPQSLLLRSTSRGVVGRADVGHPPGLGAHVHPSADPSCLGRADTRRSSIEERTCDRCNIIVKSNTPGQAPAFATCEMCRTSMCEACCPSHFGYCASCALSIGRDRTLPPNVFGQAVRPVMSSLPPAASKCAPIDLPKEPSPHELRDWITNVREIVSNAFSYDSQYAMDWVMSVENAKCIEDLDGDCLYPTLDNAFNTALRKCITSKPVTSRIARLTEEAQVKRGTRLKSRQILWCLVDYLRPDEVGSQSIRTNELFRLTLNRSAGFGEPQLEKYLDKWEGYLGGITAPIDPTVLQHIFFEQVRHSPCLLPDIQHWDRHTEVQNYEWIMKAARNAVSRWRTRHNVEDIREKYNSQSPHRNAAAPGVRRPSPFGDEKHLDNRDGRPKRDSPGREGRPRRSSREGRRSDDPRRSSRDRRDTSRNRSNNGSPAAPGVCYDWEKGVCNRGTECKFAHTTDKPKSPKIDPDLIYPGYCQEWLKYGKCTKVKCSYKHVKPPPDVVPLPPKPSAPALDQPEEQRANTHGPRLDSPAPGVDEHF